MRRAGAAAALLLFTLATPVTAQHIFLEQIATKIDQPVAVTHANDARLFVATQRGRILVFDKQLRAEPFLDLSELVRCCGEQGLLGITFHPRYAENGFFFVSYVDLEGDTVLARYRAGLDGFRADAQSRRVILMIPHRLSPMHYSGHLAFGPDGYLYMSTGDGGGDDYVHANRLDSLLGKMLRLDVEHDPYAIPPSNPFVDVPDALPEIWAYGFRNPWRFSFDRDTGDLWIGDVGQDLLEEINVQPASSSGGENYGWYGMEGTYCHEDSGICGSAPTATVAPIFEYAHEDGGCAVTGGYRYRGKEFPEVYGMYFYADFCSGVLYAAEPDEEGTWVTQEVYVGTQRISSFGEDTDGELYIVDYTGGVYALKTIVGFDRIRRLRGALRSVRPARQP
ncbi:MAG TPA: PQQ-dependent sugar dehydrogenase [Thermoanaerobaculia bacterium]|jgi:glucose/arabinose dehydrogenase|nr:PQQ-dependent sugar dehydrogenase [Thermoanaerobaculia bacterium]